MSDFLKLCEARESCRQFSDKAVEREKLISCVEAARLAPSGCNAQPWSFVLVREPAAMAAVAETTMQLGLNEWTSKAQAFFVVYEEHAVLARKLRSVYDSQYYAYGDVGMATVLLCLEAKAQGLGTCILGVFDRQRINEALNIPIQRRIRAVVAVGYPADDTVRPRKRKPLEEILQIIE